MQQYIALVLVMGPWVPRVARQPQVCCGNMACRDVYVWLHVVRMLWWQQSCKHVATGGRGNRGVWKWSRCVR